VQENPCRSESDRGNCHATSTTASTGATNLPAFVERKRKEINSKRSAASFQFKNATATSSKSPLTHFFRRRAPYFVSHVGSNGAIETKLSDVARRPAHYNHGRRPNSQPEEARNQHQRNPEGDRQFHIRRSCESERNDLRRCSGHDFLHHERSTLAIETGADTSLTAATVCIHRSEGIA